MRYLFLAFSLCFLSTACATSADYTVCDPTVLIHLDDLVSLDVSGGEISSKEVDNLEAAANSAGWDIEDREIGWFPMIFIKFGQRIKFYSAYDVGHEDEEDEIHDKFKADMKLTSGLSIGDDDSLLEEDEGLEDDDSLLDEDDEDEDEEEDESLEDDDSLSDEDEDDDISEDEPTYRERKAARKERRRERKKYRKRRRVAFNSYIDDALDEFAKDARTTCQVHPFSTRLEDDRMEISRTSDPEKPYHVLLIHNDERKQVSLPKKHDGERLKNYRHRVFTVLLEDTLEYFADVEHPSYVSN